MHESMRKPSQKGEKDQQKETEKMNLSFKEIIVIEPESRWKTIFDVIVLLLVGYSCVTNIYYVAFSQPTSNLANIIYWVVEIFFYLDFILNFFQGYRNADNNENIKDFKLIAYKYFFGWFFIDAISIFPFNFFMSKSTGNATKLIRLTRIPRMMKLIDITKISKLIKSVYGETTNDQ
jgi:hypothetical protein